MSEPETSQGTSRESQDSAEARRFEMQLASRQAPTVITEEQRQRMVDQLRTHDSDEFSELSQALLQSVGSQQDPTDVLSTPTASERSVEVFRRAMNPLDRIPDAPPQSAQVDPHVHSQLGLAHASLAPSMFAPDPRFTIDSNPASSHSSDGMGQPIHTDRDVLARVSEREFGPPPQQLTSVSGEIEPDSSREPTAPAPFEVAIESGISPIRGDVSESSSLLFEEKDEPAGSESAGSESAGSEQIEEAEQIADQAMVEVQDQLAGIPGVDNAIRLGRAALDLLQKRVSPGDIAQAAREVSGRAEAVGRIGANRMIRGAVGTARLGERIIRGRIDAVLPIGRIAAAQAARIPEALGAAGVGDALLAAAQAFDAIVPGRADLNRRAAQAFRVLAAAVRRPRAGPPPPPPPPPPPVGPAGPPRKRFPIPPPVPPPIGIGPMAAAAALRARPIIDIRPAPPIQDIGDINEIAEFVREKNLSKFKTSGFNEQTIKRVVQRNYNVIRDKFGFDVGAELIDPAVFRTQLGAVLEKGLRKALSSNNPGIDSKRAITTYASALHDAAAELDIEDRTQLNDIANQAAFRLIGDRALDTLSITPLITAEGIENTFEPEIIELLDKQNLTINDINIIRRDFNQLIADVLRQTPPEANQQFLFDMRNYVQEHVVNPQLKEALLSQETRFRQSLGILAGDRSQGLTGEIIPLNPSQGIEITENLFRDQLVHDLRLVVNSADTAINEDRFIDAQVTVINAVNKINRGARTHGLQFQLPGQRPAFTEIVTRDATGRPLPIGLILNDIKTLLNTSVNPRVKFFRTPATETEQPRVSMDRFIADFRGLNNDPPGVRIPGKKKIRESTIPSPFKINRVGNILISHDNLSRRRDIHIKSSTKKGDIVKLAALLAAENGTIEDEHRRVLLDIKRGQTTTAQLIDIIMREFNNNLGHDFVITYHPAHPVGGQFIDGFMSVHNNRALVGMNRGGRLTSSGFIHQTPKHALSEMPLHNFTKFAPSILTY